MSALFAVLFAADTILVAPLTTRGEAPAGAGVAVAGAILDAVVQANKDSFLTLKQLDALLRGRDLSLDDPAVSAIAPDLARKLGATDVVAGEVWLEGGRWRINARRLKVGQGKPVSAAFEEGSRGSLPRLAYKAAVELFGAGAAPAGPVTGSTAGLAKAGVFETHLPRQSPG